MNERTALFVCAWFLCTLAIAAETVAAAPPDMAHGLPWLSILIAIIIAIWGGLTRASLRKKCEFKTIVRDIFVATGAGFVMFNIGAYYGFNVWLMSATVYLAGWLGAQFLSAAAERLLSFVKTIRIGEPATIIRQSTPQEEHKSDDT